MRRTFWSSGCSRSCSRSPPELRSHPDRRAAAADGRVAAAVDAGDLSHAPGAACGVARCECWPHAFDHMLERLERAFKRQRDFVSDASHELRTPLAVTPRAGRAARPRDRRAPAATRAPRRCSGASTSSTASSATCSRSPSAEAGQAGRATRDRPRRLLRGPPPRPAAVRRARLPPRRRRRHARRRPRPADTGTAQPRPQRGRPHRARRLRCSVDGSAATATLEISVSDTGPGIPPTSSSRSSSASAALDQGRSRDSGGSGLGLAIARAIVEAHGGTIHAESTPGHGATFRFELPGYRPATDRRNDGPASWSNPDARQTKET